MPLNAARVVSVVVLLVLAGGFIGFGAYVPSMIRTLALEQLPLTEGSESAKMYTKIPVDLTQRIFLFNVTNKDEFLNGAIPKLEELGPYTFISVWTKNLTWDGDKIRFNETKTFVFSAELSNGTLDDEIFHVDLVYLGAVKVADSLPWPISVLVKMLLKYKTVLGKHKVRELLYEGYDDTLAKYASYFFKDLPVINGKVGFLLGQNGTAEGEYSIINGINGTLWQLNDITAYKNSTILPYYDPPCNSIYGTNGELFPPFLDGPKASISIFNKQFCRPWSLYLNETIETSGIESAKYVTGNDMFTVNDTKDQCYEKRPTGMKGTFDASSCLYNQDVVLSLPHFFKGDKRLFDTVVGLKPDPKKHDFTLSVSDIGIVTDINIRVQINAFLSSNPTDDSVPNFVYPIFWQEIIFQENAKALLMNQLWEKVVRPKLIIQGAAFGLGGLSLVIAVVLIVVWLVKDSRDLRSSQSLDRVPIQGEDEVDEEQSLAIDAPN